MADYSGYADEQLFSLLKKGDEWAFAEIYNRFKHPLYLHAYRMLQDDEEAKDLVQELFAALWTKREDIVVSTSLDAYLYGAAKNRILNFMAHQKVIARYAAHLDAYMDSGVPGNDELLIEKELMAIIEREVASLPPKMREIFELSRHEGLSHKQIAGRLGISDKTVKKQIHNATKILKPKINLSILLFLFP